MFTWKRLFLSLGFLFLIIIIGWTTWYFAVVRPKLIAEPIKRYNTESQITTDDTSDTGTVETSQEQKISQEKGETVNRHAEGEGTENTAPFVSEKLNQHTHHSHKSNGKELSAEELAKKKAEMERERKKFEAARTQLNELQTSLNELKRHVEIRNEELVNHLNSLSAEEQQAYFENIRSGKVLEELPPNFFELAKANMLSRGFSEETIDKTFGDLKREIQKYASEAGAKRHLEKLRAHGFEPKF